MNHLGDMALSMRRRKTRSSNLTCSPTRWRAPEGARRALSCFNQIANKWWDCSGHYKIRDEGRVIARDRFDVEGCEDPSRRRLEFGVYFFANLESSDACGQRFAQSLDLEGC